MLMLKKMLLVNSCFRLNSNFSCIIQKTALQSKLKAMAFQGSASVITEDMIKDQESVTTDTGQPGQPEEMPGAAGAEHMEKEDELPQQADDLSFSLDELNVTSSPESSTACPNQDYNLVNSLLNLTKSPVSCFLDFGVFSTQCDKMK